eukprot:m51a1_g1646 Cytohesin-associated scaffolding protein (654) ;mRNA; r:335220-337954
MAEGNLKTVEALAAEWASFDLHSTRQQLDKHAASIADTREASTASRKRLVKGTQEFKKSPEDKKMATLDGLLKMYQEEIDSVLRRSKQAEAAFAEAYKAFLGIPDVGPVLLNAADDRGRTQRVAELELENKRLRDELQGYQQEFSELQNQGVTVRRLEQQLRDFQQRLEDEARARAEERAQSEQAQRALAASREREAELELSVSQMQQDVARATKAHQDAQATLLNIKSTCEAQVSAKQSELDMVSAELERCHATIHGLEKSLQRARAESSSGAPSGSDSDKTALVELEMKYAQQGIEVERLAKQLAKTEEAATREAADHESTLAQLRAQLDAERAEKESLKAARPSQSEFIALLRDLETYKVLAGAADVGGSSSPAEGSAGAGSSASAQSIEQALQDRNRRLETEAIRMRARIEELEGESEQLRGSLQAATEESARMRSLIERLEDQLSRGVAPARSVLADAASPLQGPAVAAVAAPAGPAVDVPQASSAAAVLEIVCGQRDRFRDKITELEADKAHMSEQLERADADIRALRADNLKLYERVKYLQSYDEIRTTGLRTRYEAPRVPALDDEELESKYGQMYEEAVNPFAVFNRKEKYQRYKELSAPERIVLRSTSFFMSNKATRLALFGYALLLHGLVFISLYKVASSPAC